MKMTYDRKADAAYVTFGEEIRPGESAQQISLIDTPNGQTQVTIDVDADGHLLGIEILAASAGPREDVLRQAQNR